MYGNTRKSRENVGILNICQCLGYNFASPLGLPPSLPSASTTPSSRELSKSLTSVEERRSLVRKGWTYSLDIGETLGDRVVRLRVLRSEQTE